MYLLTLLLLPHLCSPNYSDLGLLTKLVFACIFCTDFLADIDLGLPNRHALPVDFSSPHTAVPGARVLLPLTADLLML